MLGGNIAYIIDQNTEDAVYGGQYGGSKSPSVTISALAHTSKKVFPNEINSGNYAVTGIYDLETNSYELGKLVFSPQSYEIRNSDIYSDNGFQKLKLNIKAVPGVLECTVIYSSPHELVLSAASSTNEGKKTYFNVLLTK